ncbi:SMP-30/gluconolactonase/LRE family protein [Stenotrophomonas maltophilia]|uniref:SMP-30/gluconolactonase/LRE family protein n=1 Tax=Stenotrophomonas maltophilia TaxID=40324 RepID=UPI0015DED702|nr:SMP-30/gluconolactonase/LRE family protein [Stenotrophomonas maltophilia]
MSGSATVVVPAANTLGEGVLWCDRESVVYWTDIAQAQLWRYRPGDGALTRWPMPERLAALALCEAEGWLLLALASRLAFFHPARGELRDVLVLPDTGARLRANDGACDRQGRFVFGMLHEPTNGPKQAVAPFYRLTAELVLETLPLPTVAIANSVAFSPDGRTMYFCDSLQKQILRCDYGDSPGAVAVFADLRAEDGEPDGSVVDAEGGLWNARWGGSRVVRYRPDGQQDRILSVPVAQPTRPVFGGSTLRTMFITSAHDGLDAAARARAPFAGHLFATDAGIAGVPEPRFAGNPNDVPPCPQRGPIAELP